MRSRLGVQQMDGMGAVHETHSGRSVAENNAPARQASRYMHTYPRQDRTTLGSLDHNPGPGRGTQGGER